MRRFLFLAAIALLTTTTQSFAQSRATVSSIVKDHAVKALQNVTVSLTAAKDSSKVKAGITGANGQFRIASADSVEFLLNYSIPGFEKKFSQPFDLQGE